jgi:hypothetical protein
MARLFICVLAGAAFCFAGAANAAMQGCGFEPPIHGECSEPGTAIFTKVLYDAGADRYVLATNSFVIGSEYELALDLILQVPGMGPGGTPGPIGYAYINLDFGDVRMYSTNYGPEVCMNLDCLPHLRWKGCIDNLPGNPSEVVTYYENKCSGQNGTRTRSATNGGALERWFCP